MGKMKHRRLVLRYDKPIEIMENMEVVAYRFKVPE